MAGATLDMTAFESIASKNAGYASNHTDGIHEEYKRLVAWNAFIIIMCGFATQRVFLEWRRNFTFVFWKFSFIVIWFVPLVISVCNRYGRFAFLWFMHFCLMGVILSDFKHTVPSRFSGFYLLRIIYMASILIGVLGFFVSAAVFVFTLVITFKYPVRVWGNLLILLPVYGIYFALITRNIAVLITNELAQTIEQDRPANSPRRRLKNRKCILCKDPNMPQNSPDLVSEDDTCKLSCGHEFHRICCSVWCFIGKKMLCPCCSNRIVPELLINDELLVGTFIRWRVILNKIEYFFVWSPAIVSVDAILSFLLSKNLVDIVFPE